MNVVVAGRVSSPAVIVSGRAGCCVDADADDCRAGACPVPGGVWADAAAALVSATTITIANLFHITHTPPSNGY